MGMPAAKPITTVEALLALPEDNLRHELLRGEHVVTPSPAVRHQRIVTSLMAQMIPVLENSGFMILTSPADLQLEQKTLVQPDLFVVEDTGFEHWRDAPTPVLAVEILSPSTASRDRGIKRQIYMESGVREYWIVDIDSRGIERWRSGDARPEVVVDELEWRVGECGSLIEMVKIFC